MSPLEQSYRPSVLVGRELSLVDQFLADELVARERAAEVEVWRAMCWVPDAFRHALAVSEDVDVH
jgi:hypothetical protein